jgi:hypothetical protein
MRTCHFLFGLGAAAVAVALCFLPAPSGAADDKGNPEVKAAIVKLVDAIQKDDEAEVKKQLEVLKKAEAADVMKVFSLRTNGGVGVGTVPGAIKPDGIDAKLKGIGTKAPNAKELAAQSADLERMALVMAAVGEAIGDKCTVAIKTGDKDPKDWKRWSKDMREQSLQLAEVLKEKKPEPMAVKTAATKLYGTCTACHVPFRD